MKRQVNQCVLALSLVASFFLVAALGAGCSSPSQPSYTTAVLRAGGTPIGFDEAKQMMKAVEQTLYIPVYTHIYHHDAIVDDLTATLSIRNADLRRAIIIQSVK